MKRKVLFLDISVYAALDDWDLKGVPLFQTDGKGLTEPTTRALVSYFHAN